MPKQSNSTPGKKPPTPSVKVKPGDFRTLVEILNGRKPRRTDDAEPAAVPPKNGPRYLKEKAAPDGWQGGGGVAEGGRPPWRRSHGAQGSLVGGPESLTDRATLVPLREPLILFLSRG